MSPSEPRSGLSGGSAQSAPPHYMVLFRKFARWRRPGCPNGREPHPITACLGCHGGFVGRARPAARMRLRHDAASPSTQPNADSHHRRRYTATGALTPRHRRPLMASHFDPLAPHALPIPPISRTTHSSVEKSPYLLTFRPCGRKTALYARPKAHCGELRRLSIKGEQVF